MAVEKALYLFKDTSATLVSSAEQMFTDTDESLIYSREALDAISQGAVVLDVVVEREFRFNEIVNEGPAGREMVLFPGKFAKIGPSVQSTS